MSVASHAGKPLQNGIVSTQVEHRELKRYSLLSYNTADTKAALPTVGPQN